MSASAGGIRGLALAALAAVALLGAGAPAAEVVAVVSARSPATELTHHQVADIFLGKTQRFPDGSLAVPVDQAEGSAERDEFYLRFAGKSPPQVNAHWSKVIFTGRGHPPKVVADAAAVKKHVADNPRSIGYLDHSRVDASLRVLVPALMETENR